MAKIGASSSEDSFNSRAGIMSGPVAFRGLLFCRSFLTPSSLTCMLFMSGYGFPSGSGTWVSWSSLVKTDWYCLLSISDLSFDVLNRRPLSFRGAIPVESLRRDLM